jgi:hypothetical protein
VPQSVSGQRPELRELADERATEDRAHARRGAQEVVLGTPHRTGFDGGVQITIDILQLSFEPLDVLSDAAAHRGQRVFQPITLSDDHPEDLAPTSQQRVEREGRLIRQRPGFGAHALAEERQHVRVDPIGLGELPGSPGEVAHLPGIRYNDRQPSGRQGGDHGALVSASRLEDHERRRVLAQALEQCPNAIVIIGNCPPVA